MKNQGILLFATGHPYYGRMAANLAMTIKASAPTVPIAVVTDYSGLKHLDDNELSLFDEIIKLEDYFFSMPDVMSLRTRLPELTPFEETMAMDVDMLWLPKRDPLSAFNLLNERDFTIVNEGYVDLDTGEDHTNGYTHWAPVDQIKEAYNLTGRLFQARGEFVVFRKSELVVEMYESARNVWESPLLKVMTLGGGVTDEFALNIAMNRSGIEPHELKWQPTFWPAFHGNRVGEIYKIDPKYFTISFGGNSVSESVRRVHDILVKDAAFKLKKRYRFPLFAKKNFLQERRYS